MRVVRTH